MISKRISETRRRMISRKLMIAAVNKVQLSISHINLAEVESDELKKQIHLERAREELHKLTELLRDHVHTQKK